MNVWVTGGGYVTAHGWGRRSEGKRVALVAGEPVLPRGAEIFDRPLSRYGRFDRYTKMGCAAAALALRDAGLDRADSKRPIGIVTSSLAECLETDLAYYDTTAEQDGLLSSPNLFSYTLPGIVHGELAVHFLLTGPTIAVGEPPAASGGPFRPGRAALETALRLLAAGKTDAMLAGWIESPPQGNGELRIENEELRRERHAAAPVAGALFVVLEARPPIPGTSGTSAASEKAASRSDTTPFLYRNGGIERPDGKPIESLLDFFQSSPL